MTEQEINELITQERRAYQKEWRAKNKDKVRQYNRNFLLRRVAARLAEQQNKQNDEHKD